MRAIKLYRRPAWDWWQLRAPGFRLTHSAGVTWFRLFGYGLSIRLVKP